MQLAGKNAENIEHAWTDYLLASGTFYSTLEQGSKLDSKTAAWFGRVKHDRKIDHLLKYLKYARDAEEHGIERITKITSSNIEVPAGGIVRLTTTDGGWDVSERSEGIKFANDICRLVRVYNTKYGDFVDPPKTFFGRQVSGPNPIELATLALPYFEKLLSDFSEL
jgi:hypothetical protein